MILSRFNAGAVLSVAAFAFVLPAAVRADSYQVDPVHSTTVFRIHHFNAGYVWGLIGGPTGTFEIDPADPSKRHVCRDRVARQPRHPRRAAATTTCKGPDWFNAKQFPTIEFKSTSGQEDRRQRVRSHRRPDPARRHQVASPSRSK